MKNQSLLSSKDKSKKLKSVLQIRRGNGKNLGIIFQIFPLKHIL